MKNWTSLIFALLVGLMVANKTLTTQTPIAIDLLKNHPELVETCARWSFGEWGHYTPDRPLADFIEARKEYLNDKALPLTLVAFDSEKPVGMCSLAVHRSVGPKELTPWVAALYVIPSHRGIGIGTALEQAIQQKAKAMGYEKLYCFTSEKKIVPWYERRGWRIRGMEWQRDHEVTVLEKDIRAEK